MLRALLGSRHRAKSPTKIRNRTQLLNYLAERHGYRSYLEIGVRNAKDNFDHVSVRDKRGVDPAADCDHRMTSDEFFAQLRPHEKFDLVLVDGLHLAAQVEKDVVNSLRHLSLGGSIVLHDCNPLSVEANSEHYEVGRRWNGTVWQAVAAFRGSRPDLSVCVIDIDEGCGVVRPGRQECYSPWPPPSLSYEYLAANRQRLLNLVSVTEFLQVDDEFARSAGRHAVAPLASAHSAAELDTY
jgi:Methyltransferase domain